MSDDSRRQRTPDQPKAFFVWMRRLVADPFPLTLSLSRKGRGNPRTISSYKCKPLYAKRRPALCEAHPARLKPLAAALFDPALDKVEDRGLKTDIVEGVDFLHASGTGHVHLGQIVANDI